MGTVYNHSEQCEIQSPNPQTDMNNLKSVIIVLVIAIQLWSIHGCNNPDQLDNVCPKCSDSQFCQLKDGESDPSCGSFKCSSKREAKWPCEGNSWCISNECKGIRCNLAGCGTGQCA